LVPAGRRPRAGVREDLVAPVGLDRAARLVRARVAPTRVGAKDHRPPGQRLAREPDLPLDREHHLRTRPAAAGKAGQPDRRDAPPGPHDRPLPGPTYHALPLRCPLANEPRPAISPPWRPRRPRWS